MVWCYQVEPAGASEVRAQLRALGVRPGQRGPWLRSAGGWDSLTATERAVSLLVAGGLANGAVARRRYISPHTVNTRACGTCSPSLACLACSGDQGRGGLAVAVDVLGLPAGLGQGHGWLRQRVGQGLQQVAAGAEIGGGGLVA